jgi:predicted nucleic acid-binding protein
VRRVVTDTGPLLHLAEANSLDLLRLLGEIHIPTSVAAEISAGDPSWRVPPWITVDALESHRVETAMAWVQAGLLHGGEADALALALQLDADWFLTDDAGARLLARTLKVEVHGSLGVVLWTAAAGLVTEAEAHAALDRLDSSSLWISAKVLAEAKAALRTIFTD